MQHQKTKRLSKKSKLEIIDLPSDGPMTVVPLSAVLSKYLKDRSRHTVKVLNKEGQLDERWLKDELPYWQGIWTNHGINIRYDRRQRSFFLTAIR